MDEKLKEYYYVGRRWALDARYACTLSALSSSVAWIRYIYWILTCTCSRRHLGIVRSTIQASVLDRLFLSIYCPPKQFLPFNDSDGPTRATSPSKFQLHSRTTSSLLHSTDPAGRESIQALTYCAQWYIVVVSCTSPRSLTRRLFLVIYKLIHRWCQDLEGGVVCVLVHALYREIADSGFLQPLCCLIGWRRSLTLLRGPWASGDT